jgi:translation elongation factor EF-G
VTTRVVGTAGHVDHGKSTLITALTLFTQPIGVDAGERGDERGLAVVDVTGGPDDAGRHGAGEGTGFPVG